MGDGLAIKPSGNTIYSPVDGFVQIVFETGHAYGIKSDKGAEILIHIGIDTVTMNGTGFTSKVKADQKVKKVIFLAPLIQPRLQKQVWIIQL